MTIKYVLRDIESRKYVSSYWEAYQSEEGESSELVVYTDNEIHSAKQYYTFSEAEYHKKLLYSESKYDVEIVRIGE